MSRLMFTAPYHGTPEDSARETNRSSPRARISRSAVLVWTLAASAVAATLTWTGVANPRSAPTWDLLDAGPAPIAPPYVDEDADAPYADAGEPYCDACTAHAVSR